MADLWSHPSHTICSFATREITACARCFAHDCACPTKLPPDRNPLRICLLFGQPIAGRAQRSICCAGVLAGAAMHTPRGPPTDRWSVPGASNSLLHLDLFSVASRTAGLTASSSSSSPQNRSSILVFDDGNPSTQSMMRSCGQNGENHGGVGVMGSADCNEDRWCSARLCGSGVGYVATAVFLLRRSRLPSGWCLVSWNAWDA